MSTVDSLPKNKKNTLKTIRRKKNIQETKNSPLNIYYNIFISF